MADEIPEGYSPLADHVPEGYRPLTPAPPKPGMEVVPGVEAVPQAFLDRLREGSKMQKAIDRIGAAFGRGAKEAMDNGGQLGIEPDGETEKTLQDLGMLTAPGKVTPLRLLDEAMIRPAAQVADGVFRLMHAGVRGVASTIAQATAEVQGNGEGEQSTSRASRDTNELDMFGQIALLLAGNAPMMRVGRGPMGQVRDDAIGHLPKADDFSLAAATLTEDQPLRITVTKFERLWQEHGVHPAEVAADAERDPVLKQQLLSRTDALPDAYTEHGIVARYGRADWNNWSDASQNSIATRQLPNGEVVPAPEAVASYLQEFGRQAGFKFQVGPATDSIYSKTNAPSYSALEQRFPDGTRRVQANVYMPDNPDYQFRNWVGLGKNEVLFHEVGHALDHFVINNQKGLSNALEINGALRSEMLEITKRWAPKMWELNPAYRSRREELMADSIAAWLSDPTLRKDMPLFTAKYGAKLDKYREIAESSLPKKVDGEWQMPPDGEAGFTGGGLDGKVPGGGGGRGGPPDGRSPSFEPYQEPPNPGSIADARKRILDRLSIGDRSSGRGYSISQLYTDVVDKFFPISKAREGAELTAANDPYKLVRLYAGWSGKADHMLNEATFDFNTYRNTGPSLKAILSPVEKDLDGFRAFVAGARAAELESKGLEHGFQLDAIKTYGEATVGKYAGTMAKLVRYQNELSKYLRDSGVLNDRAYDAMLEANKLFVPFHRVMGDDIALGQRLGGVNMTAHNPIKELVGSGREVIDPIESVIKNTYLLTSMAEKNQVGTKLIDMLIAQRADKAIDGRPAEMSPLKQIGHNGGPDVKEWLRLEGGKPDPDLAGVLRDAAIPAKEGEISIYRNGQRFSYSVDPDLANAMKGLDRSTIGLIEKMLSPLASTLRAGAVLDPEFAARHTIRDYLYSFIRAPGVYTPLDSAKGMVGLITKDADYWQWMKSGGGNATLVSLDRRYLQDNLNKLAGQTGLMTRAWNVVIDPEATAFQKGGAVLGLPFAATSRYVIHPLQLTAELAMNANHLGGFKRALRAGEKALPDTGNVLVPINPDGLARGLASASISKETLLEAGWQSRNTGIDIARSGAKTHSWNMISAFMNAKVQDTTQILEAFGTKPVSTTIKTAVAITLPSLALWAYNKDDSRYQALPEWEKDVFWIVPTDSWEAAAPEHAAARPHDQVRLNNGQLEVNNGTLWRIPKPFSTGVLFGSGAERLADLLYTKNPDAFKGFFHSLRESTVGDLTPNAIVPMLEQSANRVQYTGRTLIPHNLENQLPEYQYAPYTTELAKKLGNVIGLFPGIQEAKVEGTGQYGNAAARAVSSPILIENYVRGWTGSLGVYAMKALDYAGRKTGALDDPPHAAATLADMPLIKAFVARYPSANAQVVSDFYEQHEINQRYYATFMAQAKEGNFDAMERIQAAGGIGMFDRLDKMKQVLGEHYTAIRTIDKDSQMKPYEKRQLIDTMYYMMIEIAKDGTEMLKTIKQSSKELSPP